MKHVCSEAAEGTCKILVATFDGGHVEEWIDGNVIHFKEMMQPYCSEIATLLARLHACPLPRDACDGGSKRRRMMPKQSSATVAFFDDMAAWAAALPDLEGSTIQRDRLMDEVAWLRWQPAQSPACISHRDVHALNLVLSPSGLRLIDFEFMHVGPRAFDVVNFFLE